MDYAAKPQLTFKDDIYALFEEMIDVFRAEASYQERITKVRDKMQARVRKGYYPFRPNQGYRETGESGLHEPDPARFPLLRRAFLDVLSQEHTPTQALKRLNSAGHTTPRGNRSLDIDKFMKLLRNPYYAGAIRIADWPHNDAAPHTPMITLDEYERTLVQ